MAVILGVTVLVGVIDGVLEIEIEGVIEILGVNDGVCEIDIDGVRVGVIDGVLLIEIEGVDVGVGDTQAPVDEAYALPPLSVITR